MKNRLDHQLIKVKHPEICDQVAEQPRQGKPLRTFSMTRNRCAMEPIFVLWGTKFVAAAPISRRHAVITFQNE
jgi:hypothetical protein